MTTRPDEFVCDEPAIAVVFAPVADRLLNKFLWDQQ